MLFLGCCAGTTLRSSGLRLAPATLELSGGGHFFVRAAMRGPPAPRGSKQQHFKFLYMRRVLRVMWWARSQCGGRAGARVEGGSDDRGDGAR